MTQQPYGAPPPGYAPQQYQQPYPPQQPQYAPPMQAQPAPMQLDTLSGGVGGQGPIVQNAPIFTPPFTALEGRLLYVLPKSIDSSGQFGDKIIADVVFFDGGPLTHVVKDNKPVALDKPFMPGQLLEDVWITSSRIVNGLREVTGRSNGFAVRLDKEGKAFVLRDAAPHEAQMVAQQIGAIRAGQAGAAAAGNPFLNGQAAGVPQQPAAAGWAQPGHGGPVDQAPPQYGQQFAVPPPGYGATAAPPIGEPAPQQYAMPQAGYVTPGAPPAPQGIPAAPPPPPEQPQAAQPFDPVAYAAWQQQTGQAFAPPPGAAGVEAQRRS